MKHGRLIDADALIDIFEDRLEKIRNRYGDYSGETGVCAGALHLIRVQPTIEPEPCEDAVSRTDVFNAVRGEERGGYVDETVECMLKVMSDLPPVTPKQKIGRWIKSTGYDDRDRFYRCSECGRNINLICGATLVDYPYCHCGAKMVDPQESEDKKKLSWLGKRCEDCGNKKCKEFGELPKGYDCALWQAEREA